MTQIDKYLPQYLDGSITEQELLEFRDLLEAEPQLQTELRHLLDLRSIIHDDLLTLTPPDSLAHSVREQVGTQFALLAEEEEERRRPFILNQRFAGSFATAMVAMVLIALAPGLLHTPVGGNDNGTIASIQAPINPGNGNLQSVVEETSKELEASSARRSSVQRSVSTVNRRTTQVSHSVSNSSTIDESIATTTLADLTDPETTSEEASDQIPSNPGSNDHVADPIVPDTPQESFALLQQDKVQDINAYSLPGRVDVLVGTDLNNHSEIRAASQLFDKSSKQLEEEEGHRQRIAATVESHSSTSHFLNSDESSAPRLAFGFTVGAGGLTRSSSSVAVTQRAGYATYSLNEDHRIGLEAGGSTFRYTRTSFTQTQAPPVIAAKANTYSIYELANSNNYSHASTFAINRLGGSGSTGGNASGNGPNATGSGGGDAPIPIDHGKYTSPSLSGENPVQSGQPQQNVRGIVQSHSHESDTAMGYGMLFYDRKVVALSDIMKIHGRVGVGGTDGGLIFDLRAYAAFATHENVAITVGVGGSALREFESKTPVSANYGVQVGAEFGF